MSVAQPRSNTLNVSRHRPKRQLSKPLLNSGKIGGRLYAVLGGSLLLRIRTIIRMTTLW